MKITTFEELEEGMSYVARTGTTLHEVDIVKKMQRVSLVHYNPRNCGDVSWVLNDQQVGEIIESFPTVNRKDATYLTS